MMGLGKKGERKQSNGIKGKEKKESGKQVTNINK